MPDALSTLLNLRSTSNFSPGGGGMASSYTPQTGRSAATVGLLRKYFGLQGPDTGEVSQSDYENTFETLRQQEAEKARQEAEAKAYPEQVRGEYSVAAARERTNAARETARAAAERAAAEREFRAEQGRLGRESQMDRTKLIQSQTTARGKMSQGGINQRQRVGQAETRARALETGKVNVPADRNLSNFFGLFGPSQEERNRTEAERLRQLTTQEPDTAGEDDILSIANDYLTQYPSASDDELETIVRATQPDASDDEVLSLVDAIGALRQ